MENNTKTENMNNESKYIRVRVWLRDFDGTKTNRDEVRYFESLEEVDGKFWKWELA